MSSYKHWDDPFPNIAPALLNSADIRAYAEHQTLEGRLFEPFDTSRLKSASYEITFVDALCCSWPKDATKRSDQILTLGTSLTIPSNGIVFVCPAVKFNLPPYLALRFNLAIRWVHRGLLLGTGPLVDPGFEGHLLIPVHNLTDEDVIICASKGFIWVEVTKISPNPPLYFEHEYAYVPFDPNKKKLEVAQYFERANKGAPIRSSITTIQHNVDQYYLEMSDFKLKQASDFGAYKKDVNLELRRLERRVSLLSTAGLIGGALTVVAIVISLYQLSEATKALVLTSLQNTSGPNISQSESNKSGSGSASGQSARASTAKGPAR